MGRFDGSVALVTGASRGIGLGIAQRLVDEGARVCVTARRQDALDAAVEQLGGPEHAMAVAGKADDVEHQRDTVARIVETFGSLDLLVNNTGINPAYGPLIQLDLGAARKIVEVNCIAALSWVQQAYAAWLGEHGGAVVNVASIAGLKPAPGIGVLRRQQGDADPPHRGAGGRARPDDPGERGRPRRGQDRRSPPRSTRAARSRSRRRTRSSASASPRTSAGAVAYLLSDDASWVTGQTLVLDGGLTMTGGV